MIFSTIMAGVATFVSGQILIKIFIDPIHEYRKLIGQISISLINHAGIIFEPEKIDDETSNEISKELLDLASKLNSHISLIPCYKQLSNIGVLLSLKKISIATKNMVAISNSVKHKKVPSAISNIERVKAVRKSLRIHDQDEQDHDF